MRSQLSGNNSPDGSTCSSDTGDILIRSTRVLSDPKPEAGPAPGSVHLTVKKLRGSPGPGHDLLTSHFAAGGRGVLLSALKQRAPLRREVRVQLLDPDPAPEPRTISQDAVGVSAVQMEAELPSAPPIKAQSDLEARVCQLADGVEKLLQADRESGRSLSQQTLLHLEKLHSQQMQLQSQLLHSALRMVSGHAPVTSDLTSSGEPACLQVRHLDPAEGVVSRRQAFSVTAAETGPVSAPLTRRERRPKETRDARYHRGASSVSMATRPAAGSGPQESASESQAAAAEHTGPNQHHTQPLSQSSQSQLDQSQSTPSQSQSQPDHSRPEHFQSFQPKLPSPPSQPSTSQQTESQLQPKQNQSKSQQNQLQPKQNQSKSQQNQLQPKQDQSKSQQNLSKSQQNQLQPKQDQSKSQQNQLQPKQDQSKSQQNQSKSQQNLSKSQQNLSKSQQNQSNFSHSKSHHILSQSEDLTLVQKRPPVWSMLEEAGQVLTQVRRQKKVLEENLEVLLRAQTGEMLHCQLEALAANRDWTEEVRIKKTVDAWISTLSKDIEDELASEDVPPCRAAEAVTKSSAGRVTAVTSQKAAGSPAHRGRGRPVSMFRGTGSKTASGRRGQTAGEVLEAEPVRATGRLKDRQQVEEDGETFLSHMYGRARYEGVRRTLKNSPYLRFSSPVSPLNKKPRPRLVESVRGVKVKSCKTQTSLAPTHQYLICSHLTTGDPADFSVSPADRDPVPVAVPLGRPRMDSSSRCPSGRRQDVTSPAMARPAFSVVAMDNKTPELQSQGEEAPAAGEAPPPPSLDVMERRSEEEEESIFPGTDFLSVTDVIQQEEVTVEGEEQVQLAGGPSPPPVLYQGPVFPPTCPCAPPSQDQTSVRDLQRPLLENHLVEWVEQQLMARMISEMFHPPPSDPAQNDSFDQSEAEEQSVTSDLSDSSLIRQLVNEVLSEQVALMLGTRDAQEPEPEPLGPTELGVNEEIKLVELVPTPLPTPPPSLTTPTRETLSLATPPPSEPTSLLEESPQPITAAEPVATPTRSPAPPADRSHQALTELPLDEESPEEQRDTPPLLVTVAEERPLSIPPAPGPPLAPGSPLAPRAELSCSSSEESSSSSSSSCSSSESAETEAALKHISEGELLVSVNQLAAMTGADAVCSFSSSLQEFQDMDFDPPSEGQVRGHDLLLTLLTKMEEGVKHTHSGERPQPEGSWGREEEVSVGEVREDPTSKPHRTTDPESVSRSTEALQGPTSSPGQISADVSEVCFEATNQDLFVMGDLTVEPISTLTSDLLTSLPTSPPPHLEAAGQVDTQTGGAKKRDVHLPPNAQEEVHQEEVHQEEEHQEEEHQEEEHQEEEESLNAGDTESSVSDVF